MFYRLHHSEEEVVECMAMAGDRNSLATIHQIKGIKEETVCSWLEKAEEQVKQIDEHLVVPHKLSRIQADVLWSFVDHKGEKGGTQKRRKRNILAHNRHRNRESPAHWAGNSKG